VNNNDERDYVEEAANQRECDEMRESESATPELATLNREALEWLRSCDPDGWETQPDAADYATFDLMIHRLYGREGFDTYYSNWDTSTKDV